MNVYDPISQKTREFKTLEPKKLKIYVCGITPYDTTHVGHAFTYTIFDTLIRYTQYQGFEVNYTQNVTDIDDDILRKANEENMDWQELGKLWTDKYLDDMKWLNNQMPTHYVKATDSIPKMLEIIKKLIETGFAYEKDGTVYFEVSKFLEYGELSHFSKEEMAKISAERGADPNDLNKKAPLDFILWQKMKEGEPNWDSPWGKGRPGWHIECSAMINEFLGDQIDIHGGGKDLEYPHHESEIAQSESFTGKKPFVQNWMHAAMVLYQGEKMSKSLGNLVLISNLAKEWDLNTVRYVLLSHHYREPWEFKESELAEAKKKITQFKEGLESEGGEDGLEFEQQFKAAMEDDLNIPEALKVLEKIKDPVLLKKLLEVLGFSF
jgi:L-cysteine:1D-myo-inositol 2-amino-2-deoxy-alpha-D-glucopyranoside ligase